MGQEAGLDTVEYRKTRASNPTRSLSLYRLRQTMLSILTLKILRIRACLISFFANDIQFWCREHTSSGIYLCYLGYKAVRSSVGRQEFYFRIICRIYSGIHSISRDYSLPELVLMIIQNLTLGFRGSLLYISTYFRHLAAP
jgi:hypothetical protein